MRYVGYARVSTIRQGQSGLGLEAQRAAMAAHVASTAGELVGEYVEIESGGNNDRPQLDLAMRHAARIGGVLLIAKLDRLSRDAWFLLGLQRSGVRFVAADMPHANEMVVGFMALLAQEERRMISRRTREALAAAKARGIRLGTPGNLTPEGVARGAAAGAAARATMADEFAARLRHDIRDLGLESMSLSDIARGLNAAGVLTARGLPSAWTASAVRRVFLRTTHQGKHHRSPERRANLME